MKTAIALLSTLVLSTLGAIAQAETQNTSMISLPDFGAVANSEARLDRMDYGLATRVSTTDLVPNNAYTLWWTVYNYPENCTDGACGTDDVLLTDADGAVIITDDGLPPVNLPQWEAVGISVLRADGMVADQSGNIVFNAHLPIGDVSEAMGGPGIVLPGTAEIHLVVRDHGPADPAILNDMLNTMNGGCEADFPNPPCDDGQVAVSQFCERKQTREGR